MNEALQLASSASSGIALGMAYFAGLWWTIRRGLASPVPGLWFFGSFWIRMLLVLAGFYVTAQGDWRRLACTVSGLLAARTVLLRTSAGAGL